MICRLLRLLGVRDPVVDDTTDDDVPERETIDFLRRQRTAAEREAAKLRTTGNFLEDALRGNLERRSRERTRS